MRCLSRLQLTLAIVKPDVATQPAILNQIRQIILENKFYFIRTKVLALASTQAEKFYEEHKGKFFFDELVSFMTSGKISTHVLAKENSIAEWRALMGPTNPKDAKEKAPQSLRALFGSQVNMTQNAVHGSDSTESALREIGVFFPEFNVTQWHANEEMDYRNGRVTFDPERFEHLLVEEKVKVGI